MLSKKAKYAIKALMVLGKNVIKGPMPISLIVEAEKIPRKYLESILVELKNAGYLYSKKGTAGGYILTKSVEDILMVDIIRLMDGPIALVACASFYHYHKCEECSDEETCSIRDLYLKIRAADLNILSGTSIADMMAKEKTLADTLLNAPQYS